MFKRPSKEGPALNKNWPATGLRLLPTGLKCIDTVSHHSAPFPVQKQPVLILRLLQNKEDIISFILFIPVNFKKSWGGLSGFSIKPNRSWRENMRSLLLLSSKATFRLKSRKISRNYRKFEDKITTGSNEPSPAKLLSSRWKDFEDVLQLHLFSDVYQKTQMAKGPQAIKMRERPMMIFFHFESLKSRLLSIQLIAICLLLGHVS